MLENVLESKNSKLEVDLNKKSNSNNIDFGFNNMFNMLLDKKIDNSDKNILQIKKNIKSLFKQQNILLTLTEEKQFKNIKSMKQLVDFANKKGLNIKSINFENFAKEEKTLNLKTQTDKTNKSIENIDNKKNLKKIKTIDLLKNKTKNIDQKYMKNVNDNSKLSKLIQSKKVDSSDLNANKDIKSNIENIQHKKDENNINIFNNSNLNLVDNKNKKIDLSSILEKKEMFENKLDTDNNKLDVNLANLNNTTTNNNKVDNLLNIKNRFSNTLSNFTNDLQDSIKEYKSPISKVTISLNPENLGKVDVTLIKIGDNIKVLMNSQHNNLNIFMQNQQEFKQNLENIGFSNIDMNFNSNSKQQGQDQHHHQKNKYLNNNFYEDEEIEINAKIYA